METEFWMDKSFYRKIYVFMLLYFLLFSFCGKIEEDIKENNDLMLPVYYGETFIDVDYIFPNGDALNKPLGIKINPVTSEFFVCDYSDNCLYVFSPEGEFLKKIGTAGQGPGDLLMPKYLVIDNDGNLYVYEEGNRRISIFSKNGRFIKFFPIFVSSQEMRFSVSNKKEILVNIPERGYYITVFSIEGDVLKEIGKIEQINKDPFINKCLAEGIPFKDSTGKYYIFLEGIFSILVFNEEGNIIKEYPFDEVVGRTNIRKSWPKPEKLENASIYQLNLDIVMKNDHFFILQDIEYYEPIIELDNNLTLIRKYKINSSKKNSDYVNLFRLDMFTFFDIFINNNEIQFYIPLVERSEILRFSLNK